MPRPRRKTTSDNPDLLAKLIAERDGAPSHFWTIPTLPTHAPPHIETPSTHADHLRDIAEEVQFLLGTDTLPNLAERLGYTCWSLADVLKHAGRPDLARRFRTDAAATARQAMR